MAEEYGAEDYGEDVYGGDYGVVIDDELIDYFPDVLPRDDATIFRRYVDAFDESIDAHDKGMKYVQFSKYVDIARGRDLDRVGRLFGELGRRGTRDDDEYRAYLRSVVQSFSGRGTVPGLKFAIAAAVDTDVDNITIDEDFVNNEYEIEIENADTSFLSGVVNTLAQLADPSGVELSAPPIVITQGEELSYERTPSTVIESTSGLGSGTLSFDGSQELQ
jgi:hypothetical protein